MGTVVMARDSRSYLQQLKALLARGWLWDSLREEGKLFGELQHAVAEELARVDARGDDLVREANPRTVYELLQEAEAFAGLPDTCSPSDMTVADRRAALEQRLVGDEPVSIPDIIALAEELGVVIQIREHKANRYGSSYGGSYGGTDWQLTWDVVAPATTVTHRRHGDAFGEQYARWGYQLLECAIRSVEPAGFVLRFVYE